MNALKSLESGNRRRCRKARRTAEHRAARRWNLRGELKFLFESSEGNYVYWFERRNKGVFVAATPIDVSALLRERLFEPFETIILTSATLAVGGRFDFLKQRLGMDHGQRARAAARNSISREQALLYVPATLPDVRDAGFPANARREEIVRLLEISPGARVLPLHQLQPDERFVRARAHARALSAAAAGLGAAHGAAGKIPEHAEGAVLFATSSFWQGVDVRGEQLSCVIVDRLPFAVPSDPIVAARVRALQEDGRNPFAEYQVPEAVLALKQGFGRLIRAHTDRGVLAILDNRIQRMQYGKIFMESLPATGQPGTSRRLHGSCRRRAQPEKPEEARSRTRTFSGKKRKGQPACFKSVWKRHFPRGMPCAATRASARIRTGTITECG